MDFPFISLKCNYNLLIQFIRVQVVIDLDLRTDRKDTQSFLYIVYQGLTKAQNKLQLFSSPLR